MKGTTIATAINNLEKIILADNLKYAGFWLRFLAYSLDTGLLNIVCVFIGIYLERILSSESLVYNLMVSTILYFLITLFYYALFESSVLQATIGKRALGLKVIDYWGSRISLQRAIGRYFGQALSFFTLGIGFIMISFTKKKQALHDLMARCLIIDDEVEKRELSTILLLIAVVIALYFCEWMVYLFSRMKYP